MDSQGFYDYIETQIDRISKLDVTPEKRAELYSAVEETIEMYQKNENNFARIDRSVQIIVENGKKLDELLGSLRLEITGIKYNLDRIVLATKPASKAVN